MEPNAKRLRTSEASDPAEVQKEIWAAGGLRGFDSFRRLLLCGEGEPKYRLGYFPIRGLGELPRLILEEAGCCYEYDILAGAAFADAKPTLQFGRLPVLYNYDGKNGDLVQSHAIVRFLAKKLGLAGKTEEEQAAVDMIYCQYQDTFLNSEYYSVVALRGVTEKKGPSFKEMKRVNTNTIEERSLATLHCFEELLEKQGTGFLAGDAPTYVDLALFNSLFELAEEDNVPDFGKRFEFPKLNTFLETMEVRPRLKEYLMSSRRMPRFAPPNYVFKPGKYSQKPTDP